MAEDEAEDARPMENNNKTTKSTQKSGQYKYSGWSGAGICQFNNALLHKIVEEGRNLYVQEEPSKLKGSC